MLHSTELHGNARERVLDFMGKYVQNNPVPYEALPTLMSDMLKTFGANSEEADTPDIVGKVLSQGAVSVSSENTDASDDRPVAQAKPSISKPAVETRTEVITEKRGRGRPKKAYVPSEYVLNFSKAMAVPVKKSVHNDGIICLIDGKKKTLLRPYLKTKYGLTPEDYRFIFGLDEDYPMTCPDYAEKRREMAKENGLGYKGNAA